MIRVAAVGDVHAGTDSAGRLAPKFAHVSEHADVLLLAGDLTRTGRREEAAVLAAELHCVGVPVIAVLGNHDYHSECEGHVRFELEETGITVLEGESVVVDVHGEQLGVAGVKGFGGGFAGACGSEFGEPEMKRYIRHTREIAQQLTAALTVLSTDITVALMHYSPVPDTLVGERLEIYPFLGSYLLAEAVDAAGADLVIHGHAHGGTEKGRTPGGVHVRNVALPVLRKAYAVYRLGGAARLSTPGPLAAELSAAGVGR
ncbi:MAG: metallophosphoesterase [Mycobacteriales bacterium]